VGCWSFADSPIIWEHDGLKDCDDYVQEQYGTAFCRTGNVELTIGGAPTHTVLKTAVEPGRWKVTLMGARVGPFYVSIEPDVSSPQLEPSVLQKAVSKTSNGLSVISIKRCEADSSGLTGDELFRVTATGRKPAFVQEAWSCGASNCSASFVLTFSEDDGRKLMDKSYWC